MSDRDDYWFDLGYAKGKASRDAEVAELKRDIEACPKGWHHSEVVALEKERDQLREQVKMLRDALESIHAIEDKLFGSDWEEIDEARDIANVALAATEKLK